jgi:hypothetical protein
MLHELKCHPVNFSRISRGNKVAEFRKNDRGYEIGDFLYLRVWDPKAKVNAGYTGSDLIVQIVDKDDGGQYGIPQGYSVLSIRLFDRTI